MIKILVPTDFSDNAWDALCYAIRLYDDIPAVFFIVNTYQVSSSRITNKMNEEKNTHIFRALKEESENELAKLDTHLMEHMLNEKHTYKTFSKSGALTSVLKWIIKKEAIDLMVMGTTGASGLKEIFMGSNTVRVIKQIDLCPILSVPKDFQYEEPDKVVFGTDYKRRYSPMELNVLVELQLLHNFKIKIVHVTSDQDLSEIQILNKQELLKCFKDELIEFEEIEHKTSISKALYTYSKSQNVHLICLTNYEHSFLEKLTHEPVIKNVSFHSEVPLLILQV